jgi:hypothetical protein
MYAWNLQLIIDYSYYYLRILGKNLLVKQLRYFDANVKMLFK